MQNKSISFYSYIKIQSRLLPVKQFTFKSTLCPARHLVSLINPSLYIFRHLLGLLLSQLSLLLDLLLFVDGDVRVSLSVGLPLPGCLLLTAHLVVRTPGFVQLRTNQNTPYYLQPSGRCGRYITVSSIQQQFNLHGSLWNLRCTWLWKALCWLNSGALSLCGLNIDLELRPIYLMSAHFWYYSHF